MTAQYVTGRIVESTSQEDEKLLTEVMSLLREHGLDLYGFHLSPILVDIAPAALKLVKPLFDIRGAGVGLQFFPCKFEVMGMPFFGYLWVSENTKLLRIIGPNIKSLTQGETVGVEMESSRALFV